MPALDGRTGTCPYMENPGIPGAGKGLNPVTLGSNRRKYFLPYPSLFKKSLACSFTTRLGIENFLSEWGELQEFCAFTFQV